MPDLMSHILIALILAEIFGIKKKSLVLLGALIPDLLAKIQLIYFYFNIPPVISFVSFHTPIMCFLLSILIAPLFRYDKLKTILFLNIGSISHFLIDLTMKHFIVMGTRLFFPFTDRNYTFNLIWPEQSIYIFIGSLFVYLMVRYVKRNVAYGLRNNIE